MWVLLSRDSLNAGAWPAGREEKEQAGQIVSAAHQAGDVAGLADGEGDNGERRVARERRGELAAVGDEEVGDLVAPAPTVELAQVIGQSPEHDQRIAAVFVLGERT